MATISNIHTIKIYNLSPQKCPLYPSSHCYRTLCSTNRSCRDWSANIKIVGAAMYSISTKRCYGLLRYIPDIIQVFQRLLCMDWLASDCTIGSMPLPRGRKQLYAYRREERLSTLSFKGNREFTVGFKILERRVCTYAHNYNNICCFLILQAKCIPKSKIMTPQITSLDPLMYDIPPPPHIPKSEKNYNSIPTRERERLLPQHNKAGRTPPCLSREGTYIKGRRQNA